MTPRWKTGLGLAALACAAALGMAGWLGDDAAVFVKYAVSREAHAGLFLTMFALLPLAGFPISPFLILLGVKFGAWGGVLVWFGGMPIHLLVAFLVANSFLRSILQRSLQGMAYPLPQIPENRILWFSLVFMAVPGLPYAVKNYTLPLAGAPFRPYFLSGYLVQGVMGIPFVVAGDAVAGRHLIILGGLFVVILAIYAAVHRLRKRHRTVLGVQAGPVFPSPGEAGNPAEGGPDGDLR